MQILYDLLNISRRLNREISNNLLVTPQTTTIRVLGETLETTIISRLQEIEREENRLDAIPKIQPKKEPENEPAPIPEPPVSE